MTKAKPIVVISSEVTRVTIRAVEKCRLPEALARAADHVANGVACMVVEQDGRTTRFDPDGSVRITGR